MPASYAFAAVLWESEGPAAWCFVTLPPDAASEIADRPTGPGFGSHRVVATIGGTSWRTSVFPDSRRESYLLPVRRDVRRRERLSVGDCLQVVVELVDEPVRDSARGRRR